MTGKELREDTEESSSNFVEEAHGESLKYVQGALSWQCDLESCYEKGALYGPPVEYLMEALEHYAKMGRVNNGDRAREALKAIREARGE